MKSRTLYSLATCLLLFGCTSTPEQQRIKDEAAANRREFELQHKPQKPEPGPDGTIAYSVEVDSNEPGARIEVNNDYVGKAPMTLKIFGDKDGTFHNFGSFEYTVRANPVRAGHQPQTKVFKTGGWFTPEDKIPKRIFFDFGPPGDEPKPKE